MSDKKVTYEGADADVQWDGKLCIHIGECGKAQGDLFVGRRKPWCQPDLVSLGNVIDVTERIRRKRWEEDYLWEPTSREITEMTWAVWPETAGKPVKRPKYVRGTRKQ